MFQAARCSASCCSPSCYCWWWETSPCWWWETCPASRGTLDTAPMSVSATGLHFCLFVCLFFCVSFCLSVCLTFCVSVFLSVCLDATYVCWFDMGFFSTYCDEFDPVVAVDGQILHYVSDRVFKCSNSNSNIVQRP